MTDANISDRVVSTAESLEASELTDERDLDALEYRFECSFDGTVREVTAVLGVGGPHIEVDLFRGVVSGNWGGESHSVPIIDTETDDQLQAIGEYLAERFAEQFESR